MEWLVILAFTVFLTGLSVSWPARRFPMPANHPRASLRNQRNSCVPEKAVYVWSRGEISSLCTNQKMS